LATYNLTSVDSSYVFISKIDSSGNFLWAQRLGGLGSDGSESITIDAGGNAYSTGYFDAVAAYNPTQSFVLKLNASGNFLWEKTYGGLVFKSAASANGDIY